MICGATPPVVTDSASATPYRGVARVRNRTSTYVGRDHYEFHKRLTSPDKKPIPVSGTDFYVDLDIIPVDSPELKVFGNLFAEATQGKNPHVPSTLPSSLFVGKRDGDLISFCWNQQPVELKLFQKQVFPLEGRIEELKFEEALKCVEKGVEQSVYQQGGFDNAEDQDPNVIISTVLKNAHFLKVSQKGDMDSIAFTQQVLDSSFWAQFEQEIAEENRARTEPFVLPHLPAYAYQKLDDGARYQLFLNAVRLKLDSLKVLVNSKYFFMMGDIEPIEKGFVSLTRPLQASHRKLFISFHEGPIIIESLKAKCENGLLIVDLSVQKQPKLS